jgi:protein-S-isoprenylcysteine O-methyltransferase Ste14
MLVLKSLIGVAFQVALFAALLLLPAGTWDWPRAVQFLVFYGIVVTIAVLVLARIAPRGLEARLSVPVAASQPMADRIATALLVLTIIAWFVFIPIDVFRLHLLPSPSMPVSVLGAVVSIVGLGIMLMTVYQNEFVAPIVKDQSERGQILVDTGLYGRIRHPMYLGILGWLFGLAFWLESTAGALAVLVLLPSIFARIRVEERTLRETIEGYADYMTRVPYRLVPFVW